MQIEEWGPGDVAEMKARVGTERDAVQRDKYRAVIQAMGGREAPDIAHALGRSRRAVQGWVYAYRDGGLDALVPGRSTGRPTTLPRDLEARFRARLKAGPTEADGGVCTLRGLDAVRILAAEFGVAYTLDGAYGLLHRLGYSCLTPRPRHEKNDPVAARAFQERAPQFVAAEAAAAGPEVEVRTFFMDEARFGQQGTITNVWAETGSRPTTVRQTKYEWCYLYAAVEPATGASAALIAPNADTGTMNQFLTILDAERLPDQRIVLVMDGAGWHKSKALRVPSGITVLLLPAYSPELNPVENLWHFMRSHYLSNRAYQDYDALFDAGTGAYRRLTPEILRTVCACPYLTERTD